MGLGSKQAPLNLNDQLRPVTPPPGQASWATVMEEEIDFEERFNEAIRHSRDIQAARYQPMPPDLFGVELPKPIKMMVPALSEQVHDVWATTRCKGGWEFGKVLDEANKKHPDLVPFGQLTHAAAFSLKSSGTDFIFAVP